MLWMTEFGILAHATYLGHLVLVGLFLDEPFPSHTAADLSDFDLA